MCENKIANGAKIDNSRVYIGSGERCDTDTKQRLSGWGLSCIEPVKEFFLSLKKNRKCKLINAAVSNTKVKKVKFYKTGQLSRIVNSKDKTKKIQMVKNYKLEKFQRNIVDP